ncbi:MAG: hypothetical protein AAF202_09300, partial [Pseudomonadota bacterium]
QNCSNGFEAISIEGESSKSSSLSSDPEQLKVTIEWDSYVAGEDSSPRVYISSPERLESVTLYNGSNCRTRISEMTLTETNLYSHQFEEDSMLVGSNLLSYRYLDSNGTQSKCLSVGDYVYRGSKIDIIDNGSKAFQVYQNGSFVQIPVDNQSLSYMHFPQLDSQDFKFDLANSNSHGWPYKEEDRSDEPVADMIDLLAVYPSISVKETLINRYHWNSATETAHRDYVVITAGNELVIHRGALGHYDEYPNVERFPFLPADGIYPNIKSIDKTEPGEIWVLMESGDIYGLRDCHPEDVTCADHVVPKQQESYQALWVISHGFVFALKSDGSSVENLYADNTWTAAPEAASDLASIADDPDVKLVRLGSNAAFVSDHFHFCYSGSFNTKQTCPVPSNQSFDNLYISNHRTAVDFGGGRVDVYSQRFGNTDEYSLEYSRNDAKTTLAERDHLFHLLNNGTVQRDQDPLDTSNSRFQNLSVLGLGYNQAIWGIDQFGDIWEYQKGFSPQESGMVKLPHTSIVQADFDWSKDELGDGLL